MSDTADRLNDVMLMIIGLQLSIVGAFIDELIVLLAVGPLFTIGVYTNELRRRR